MSHCKLGSFADDTRVWYIIKTLNEQAQLQRDFDKLYDWAEDNNFTFNEKKFEHLSFGRGSIVTKYNTANSKDIQQKEVVRDLGVHFSATGNFTDHIQRVVAEAKKLSGFIL